jgi:hypothetical protein
MIDVADCVLWDGETNNRGYPTIGSLLVHRWVYESVVGPIPEGLEIDHLCSQPSCIEPLHLEAVTHAENCRRGTAGEVNRERLLALTHCKWGHEFTEENTYRAPKTGFRNCRVCLRRRSKSSMYS